LKVEKRDEQKMKSERWEMENSICNVDNLIGKFKNVGRLFS